MAQAGDSSRSGIDARASIQIFPADYSADDSGSPSLQANCRGPLPRLPLDGTQFHGGFKPDPRRNAEWPAEEPLVGHWATTMAVVRYSSRR